MGLFGNKKKRAERKKARQEKRAKRKEVRATKKADRKLARATKKANRKSDRRAFKLEKKSQRQNTRLQRQDRRNIGKTNRTSMRQDTKQVAYQNGMDPNAWVGDVSQAVGQVAQAFGGNSIPGIPNNSQGVSGGIGIQGQAYGTGESGSILQKYGMYIVGALALFFITKKK